MSFEDIEYLKQGSSRQRHCYKVLKELDILSILHDYNPVVVGTIPIGIDIEGSDIDVACSANNLSELRDTVNLHFSICDTFTDRLEEVYVANFKYSDFPIEIYAESIPTLMQNGYRHMIIEDRIMRLAGVEFRKHVIKLKQQGYKTEPAFGQLLKLNNPYEELLNLEQLRDEQLISFITTQTLLG